MIRTAILAGILLVMLSMAYSRQSLPIIAQPAALLEQPQVKAVVHAGAKPALKAPAPVIAEEAPLRAPRAVAKEDFPPAPAPVPAKIEALPQPVAPPALAVVAQREPISAPAPAEAPLAVAAPRSLLPSVAPVQAQVAEAPARPLVPLVPPVEAALVPAPAPPPVQIAKTEPPKVEDIPTIAVAKPSVHIPTELDLPASPREPVVVATAPAADAPAKTAQVAPQNAPKFMTPQERSRDLYRLAREMEDTFLGKLAR